MSGRVTYIGAFDHPAAGLRREPFSIRVAVGAMDDPSTRWRIPKGSCPACRKAHDEVRLAWRRPRRGEAPGGVVFIDQIADPLPDPNADYPTHPREVKVALG